MLCILYHFLSLAQCLQDDAAWSKLALKQVRIASPVFAARSHSPLARGTESSTWPENRQGHRVAAQARRDPSGATTSLLVATWQHQAQW
jgi:hypothetical protein